MKVKIYCLYEPHTFKIRYIGRTKMSLDDRLYRHIYTSKNYLKLNKNGSYKINWINSLLKKGIKPRIKLLTTIEGWKESHTFEKQLIQKHFKKHNLVNGDDRGPGNFCKNPTKESENNRINNLKNFYSKEENKKNFYNKLYAYNLDGSLYKEYKSVKFAAEELDINPKIISNLLSRFDNYNSFVTNRKGFYFSKNLYDKHPLSIKDRFQRNHKKIIIQEKDTTITKVFLSIEDFRKYYQLNSWDIHQYRNNIFTTKMKILLDKIEIRPC